MSALPKPVTVDPLKSLGVAAPADYRRTLRRTIDAKILPRLATHGVVVAAGALDRVLEHPL